MCDVPSIAVFFSESVECFPGTVSKFFLKLLVTIPVALIIIIIIIIIITKGNSTMQYGHTASCTQRASYLNCATFSNDLLASEGRGT